MADDTATRPTLSFIRFNRSTAPFDELRSNQRSIVIELTHDSKTTSDPVLPKDWAPRVAKGESTDPASGV